MIRIIHNYFFRKELLFVAIIFLIGSCKKSEVTNEQPGEVEWMVTMPDTILASSDDEMYQGRNGKIVTDDQQNIYCYYFRPNSHSAVVLKCEDTGAVLWRKIIPDCEPMDMVYSNGKIILATRFDAIDPKGMVLYAIGNDGSLSNNSVHVDSTVTELNFVNAFIKPLADNSFVIAGTFNYREFTNTPTYNYGYVLKLHPDLSMEWKQLISPATLGNSYTNACFFQGSVRLTDNYDFLFEFSIGGYDFVDSSSYGILTGLINPNGAVAYTHFYQTGFFKTGNQAGFYNRYTYGLTDDGSRTIYHFSCPQYFVHSLGGVRDGFMHIGNDALIQDTIPLNLTVNHRILCCVESNGKFLMTTFRVGVASGTDDFSANQTEFIYGNNWMQTGSFRFQNFYADFFPSIAPASDGSFLLMGKIQSFNERYNKLILIKWRPD